MVLKNSTFCFRRKVCFNLIHELLKPHFIYFLNNLLIKILYYQLICFILFIKIYNFLFELSDLWDDHIMQVFQIFIKGKPIEIFPNGFDGFVINFSFQNFLHLTNGCIKIGHFLIYLLFVCSQCFNPCVLLLLSHIKLVISLLYYVLDKVDACFVGKLF